MRHCYVLRVFTRGDTGGNHLGVVTDVTGLDGGSMQTIAADLGFSETIFIDWRSEGVPAARIFTPASEILFAGHPLVGAAWVLGMMGPGTVDRITCGIGEVAFETTPDETSVELPLAFSVDEATDVGEVVGSARLPDPIAAWWVSLPRTYLVLDVGSPVAVVAADPDLDVLTARDLEVYLMSHGPDTVKARFFAPALGVSEDPATGSAAVALAAVRQAMGEAKGSLVIHQGDEIGHPSTVRVRWDEGTVRLGGSVVRDEVRVLEL